MTLLKICSCSALLAATIASTAGAATIDDELVQKGFAIVSKHYCTRDKDLAYTDADLVTKLSMAACKGEFEPVTLTVIAGKDLAGVEVKVSDLKHPNGGMIPASAAELRWQKALTTGSGQAEVARQLLYPATKPVDIKKGENLRFWITIRVPDSAAQGQYDGQVSIRGNGISASVPLQLKVYNFKYGRLPGRDVFMIGVPDEIVYYRDCAEHGMTAICSDAGPVLRYAPDGTAFLPVLDQNLKMAVEVGLGRTFYAYCSFAHTSKVKNSNHILEFHEYVHPTRLMKAAEAYRDKRLKDGIPEVIWYIFDEPGKGDKQQLGPLRNRICNDFYTQVSELPGVRTFLTMGHEEAEEFGKAVSVHCYGGAPTPEDVARTRECGALVSRYSNGISMGTNPLYSRFAMGFFPWRCDYDQSTSWTYPVQGGLGEDGKPIPPDVWEAIREGVDDWYYLLTLEKLTASAKATAPAKVKAIASEAETFLSSLKQAIDPYKERCPWADGREVDAKRAAVADFIEKLIAAGVK